MQGTVGREINFFYYSPQPLLGSIVPVVYTTGSPNAILANSCTCR